MKETTSDLDTTSLKGFVPSLVTGAWIPQVVTPAQAAKLCDLDEQAIVDVARQLATARSASIKVDLGIYHNLNMLESCFLLPLLHVATGTTSKTNSLFRLLEIDFA